MEEFLKKIIEKNYKKKFIFLSAHDTNLNSILLGLKYFKYTTNFNEFIKNRKIHENPKFASTIIFELHKNKHKNGRKV